MKGPPSSCEGFAPGKLALIETRPEVLDKGSNTAAAEQGSHCNGQSQGGISCDGMAMTNNTYESAVNTAQGLRPFDAITPRSWKRKKNGEPPLWKPLAPPRRSPRSADSAKASDTSTPKTTDASNAASAGEKPPPKQEAEDDLPLLLLDFEASGLEHPMLEIDSAW